MSQPAFNNEEGFNETQTNNKPVQIKRTGNPLRRKVAIRASILLVFLAICWAIVIYDEVAPKKIDLLQHGIWPRTKRGLFGICISPFIHIGFKHVATNSLGVLLLGPLLMLYSLLQFFGVTAFVWFVGGFFEWCIGGTNKVVVGASGLVFGWFGYLLITPFFARPFSVKMLGLALAAGVIYGGLIFGVFDASISWEDNISGLASGVLCSLLYWVAYLRFWKKRSGATDKSEKQRLISGGSRDLESADPDVSLPQIQNPFQDQEPGRPSYGTQPNTSFVAQQPTYSNKHTTNQPSWAPAQQQSSYQSTNPTTSPPWARSQTEKVYESSQTTQQPAWLDSNVSVKTGGISSQKQENSDPFSFMNRAPSSTGNGNSNAAEEIFNPFAPTRK